MKHLHLKAALAAVAIISGLSSCEKPEVVELPVLKVEKTSVQVPAEACSETVEFTLENPVEGSVVTATSSEDWIKPSVKESSIYLAVTANTNSEERSAKVTVKYPKAEEVEITVTQAGYKPLVIPVSLEVEKTQVSVTAASCTEKIGFTLKNAGENEKITLSSSQEWVECSIEESNIVLSIQANYSEERSAEVTVSHLEVEPVVITVNQTAAGEEITLSESSKTIPVEGGSFEIQVISDREWTLEGAVDWVEVSAAEGKPGDKVSFNVAENSGLDIRTASYTFKCASKSVELTISQEGRTIVSSIKDAVLKQWLLDNADLDRDGAISAQEAAALTTLEIKGSSNPMDPSIETLEGLEFFTNLETINLYQQGMVEADFSMMKNLRAVNVGYSKYLFSLNLSGCTNLEIIEAGGCAKLSKILTTDCTSLKNIIAYASGLSVIDVSLATDLESLTVYSTKIETLDLTNNEKLRNLSAGCETLYEVKMPSKSALTSLSLSGASSLVSIDLAGCTALRSLSLSSTSVRSLDLSKCEVLESVDIDFTKKISTLDISKNYRLRKVNAYLSNLTKLITFKGQWDIIKPNCLGVSDYMVKGYEIDIDYPSDCASFITDESLRNYILNKYDADGDGKISGDEAEKVTTVKYAGKGLKSFDNFLFFRNIEVLDLSDNNLTSIELGSFVHSLKELNLSGNNIKELSVDGAVNIEILNISNNSMELLAGLMGTSMSKIKRIDASNNRLKTFRCSYNTSLTYANVSNNELTVCDLDGCTSLSDLNVSYNQLTNETNSLVRPYTWTSLNAINLSYNNFERISSDRTWTDAWENLIYINCMGCAVLKELDLSPNAKLRDLYIKECPKLSTVTINAGANPYIEKDDNTTIERK
ncbi:MAG: BACON domain-containing protein [Candidatus Cryptobacteroides sp.]